MDYHNAPNRPGYWWTIPHYGGKYHSPSVNLIFMAEGRLMVDRPIPEYLDRFLINCPAKWVYIEEPDWKKLNGIEA